MHLKQSPLVLEETATGAASWLHMQRPALTESSSSIPCPTCLQRFQALMVPLVAPGSPLPCVGSKAWEPRPGTAWQPHPESCLCTWSWRRHRGSGTEGRPWGWVELARNPSLSLNWPLVGLATPHLFPFCQEGHPGLRSFPVLGLWGSPMARTAPSPQSRDDPVRTCAPGLVRLAVGTKPKQAPAWEGGFCHPLRTFPGAAAATRDGLPGCLRLKPTEDTTEERRAGG